MILLYATNCLKSDKSLEYSTEESLMSFAQKGAY